MELLSFVKTVSEGVQKQVGENYHVTVMKNLKNNSVELTGIAIKKEGERVAPTIYVNDLYHLFVNEQRLMKQVIEEVVLRYKKSREAMDDIEKLSLDYESCCHNIIYRLISRKRNKRLLEQIPYIPFLDMAITFHVVVSYEDKYMQSLKIDNKIQQKLNLTVEQLLKIARENTENILPVKMERLEDVVSRFTSNDGDLDIIDMDEQQDDAVDLTNSSKMDMIVLSNDIGINGASVILYQDLIEKIADNYDSNLYIIPSSIHEMIVVPQIDEEMYDVLSCMVKEINEKFVDEDEILSDRVYIYLKEDRKFI